MPPYLSVTLREYQTSSQAPKREVTIAGPMDKDRSMRNCDLMLLHLVPCFALSFCLCFVIAFCLLSRLKINKIALFTFLVSIKDGFSISSYKFLFKKRNLETKKRSVYNCDRKCFDDYHVFFERTVFSWKVTESSRKLPYGKNPKNTNFLHVSII